MTTREQLAEILRPHCRDEAALWAAVEAVDDFVEHAIYRRSARLALEMTELSPRERECLTLAAGGQARKNIADTLKVSVGTVDATMGRAFRKLKVSSITEAIARCHVFPSMTKPGNVRD